MSTDAPVLEAAGIQKRFGSVVALSDANFSLAPGEVHAIVGDNGAGKSTLLKILAGVHRPDAGTLYVNGESQTMHSPRDAMKLGVATVFQNLALADHLNVTANLFLGREVYYPAPLSWIRVLNNKAMRRQGLEELKRLKIGIRSVDQKVMRMSGGQRQAVAVARACAFGANIVIMDEPTAALGVRESAAVMRLIEAVRETGTSVILISHNLPEVFEVADKITVMRLGRTVASTKTADTTLGQTVEMMTGASFTVG